MSPFLFVLVVELVVVARYDVLAGDRLIEAVGIR